MGEKPTYAELEKRVQELEAESLIEDASKHEFILRRALFAQSPDGILIIDPNTGRFLDFNDAAHQQLGYSREEFAQLNISDVEVQETNEETKKHIEKVLRNGRDDFDTLQRTKVGEISNIHVTAQLLTVGGQQVYQCIWRDITERKRAEEKLLHIHELM
ncbi:MAG: PAS domain S-box protein, partial [Syntrophales bacterium]